jgi:hypothetical protein
LEAISASSKPKSSVPHSVWATISWVACGVQHWLIAKRACGGGERYAAEWATTSSDRVQMVERLRILSDSGMIDQLIDILKFFYDLLFFVQFISQAFDYDKTVSKIL